MVGCRCRKSCFVAIVRENDSISRAHSHAEILRALDSKALGAACVNLLGANLNIHHLLV
jgi:hypothetical protein